MKWALVSIASAYSRDPSTHTYTVPAAYQKDPSIEYSYTYSNSVVQLLGPEPRIPNYWVRGPCSYIVPTTMQARTSPNRSIATESFQSEEVWQGLHNVFVYRCYNLFLEGACVCIIHKYTCTHVCVSTYIYICIYIFAPWQVPPGV